MNSRNTCVVYHQTVKPDGGELLRAGDHFNSWIIVTGGPYASGTHMP